MMQAPVRVAMSTIACSADKAVQAQQTKCSSGSEQEGVHPLRWVLGETTQGAVTNACPWTEGSDLHILCVMAWAAIIMLVP